MCKSNHYAVHLKLIQCCQLQLNKTARKNRFSKDPPKNKHNKQLIVIIFFKKQANSGCKTNQNVIKDTISANLEQEKFKENHAREIITKLLKPIDRNILRDITYQETMTIDFSLTIRDIKTVENIFQCYKTKEEDNPAAVLYPEEISFRNEGKMN